MPSGGVEVGGIRNPAWYLLLVAVLGILSRCQSPRDLARFAIRHHSMLTEALGIDLSRPPSDSAFRYFFCQVDVAALCTAIQARHLFPTCLRTTPGALPQLVHFRPRPAGSPYPW